MGRLLAGSAGIINCRIGPYNFNIDGAALLVEVLRSQTVTSKLAFIDIKLKHEVKRESFDISLYGLHENLCCYTVLAVPIPILLRKRKSESPAVFTASATLRDASSNNITL